MQAHTFVLAVLLALNSMAFAAPTPPASRAATPSSITTKSTGKGVTGSKGDDTSELLAPLLRLQTKFKKSTLEFKARSKSISDLKAEVAKNKKGNGGSKSQSPLTKGGSSLATKTPPVKNSPTTKNSA